MKRLTGLLLVWMVVCFGSAPAQELRGPYQEIVVFGDSLCDTGNSFEETGIPPFPYYQGRFSNGPIWIDFLQWELGLTEGQVLNYAVGGASTGFGFSPPPSGVFDAPEDVLIPTVGTQIELYFLEDMPRENQLFILWAGSNDLFNGQFPSVAAWNMEQHVRALAAAGAKEFLIPNLSPIGNTPAVNGTFEGLILNLFAYRFNRQLAKRLNALEDQLDVTIHRMDVFTLTIAASIFPQFFGFTNTQDAALLDIADGVIEPWQATTYVYWDIIHPTSLTHSIIAAEALEVLFD